MLAPQYINTLYPTMVGQIGKTRMARHIILNAIHLETREVPAGNVLASLTFGKLKLIGIDVPNANGVQNLLSDQDITITGNGPGNYRVAGNNNTTVNGQPFVDFTGVQKIDAEMRLGNDVVNINSANQLSELYVNGGSGNNHVEFGTLASNQTFGNVKIINGDGDDTIRIHQGSITMSGNLTINNDYGASGIFINDLASADEFRAKSVIVSNTDGRADFKVFGALFQINSYVHIDNHLSAFTETYLQSDAVNVLGKLKIRNQDGADKFFLGSDTKAVDVGEVDVFFGNGNSATEIAGATVQIRGNFSSCSGDGSDMFQSTLASSLTINGDFRIINKQGGSDILMKNAIISGSVYIENHDGYDGFTTNGTEFYVSKNFAMKNGVGGANLKFQPTTQLIIGGQFQVINGDGIGTAIVPNQLTIGVANTLVNLGKTSISNGTGDCILDFIGANTTIFGNLNLYHAGGYQQIEFGNITVHGSTNYQSKVGDLAWLFLGTNTQLNGHFIVKTGFGNDEILAASTLFKVLGNVNISYSSGNSLTRFQGTDSEIGGIFCINAVDGNDVFRTEGTSFTAKNDVKFSFGNGQSETIFGSNTDTLLGNFVLNSLNGDDTLEVNSTTFTIDHAMNISFANGVTKSTIFNSANCTLRGPLYVSGSIGNDAFEILKPLSARSFFFEGGNNNSQVKFNAPTTFNGDIRISCGQAGDTIEILKSTNVTGTVTINTRFGEDSIKWDVEASTVGSLNINTGEANDEVRIALLTVNNSTQIDLGSSNDLFILDDSIFNHDFNLIGGIGFDDIRIETNNTNVKTRFNRSVSVKLNSGNDLLDIGIDNDTDDGAIFSDKVLFDGGDALDQLKYSPMPNSIRGNTFQVNPLVINFEYIS